MKYYGVFTRINYDDGTHCDLTEYQRGLDELEKHGYIRIEREHNKKGSPESEVIYINPEAIPKE